MNIRFGIGLKYGLLMAATGIIVLALTTLVLFAIISRGGDEIRDNLRKVAITDHSQTESAGLRAIAGIFSESLFNPLYQLDIGRINRLINDLKTVMPVKSVLVAENTGKVLTDGTKENKSYGAQLDIDFEGIKPSPIMTYMVENGTRVVFGISAGGSTAGYGEIIVSDEYLKKEIKQNDEAVLRTWKDFKDSFLKMALSGMAGMLLFTMVFSIIFSRRLSSPLVGLKEAAKKVAEGGFDYRVPVKTKDEIGELAASFNQMVDALQKTTVSRDELAKEVEERKKAEDELKRVYGELQEKSKYLERLNRQMVGRETRVLEMKKEVNDLLERVGEAKRYEHSK